NPEYLVRLGFVPVRPLTERPAHRVAGPVQRGKADVKIIMLQKTDIGTNEFADGAQQFLVEDERPKTSGLCQSVGNSPSGSASPGARHGIEVPDHEVDSFLTEDVLD